MIDKEFEQYIKYCYLANLKPGRYTSLKDYTSFIKLIEELNK